MDSATQIQQLEEQLSGKFHVVVCNNGLDGLEILKEFDPDIVVVNLMLSGMDGISMLELAWDCGIRPQVIAITEHISDYITNALERMNVSCLLRGNCETCYLIARIIDVAQWQDDSAQGRRIETILASLGFKMNTSGCKITQLALEKFAEDTTQKVTTIRYLNFKPEVAKVYEDIAKAYEKETGVKLVVETAASGNYEQTLTAKMGTKEAPTLFQINGPKGYANWKNYCADLSNTELCVFERKYTNPCGKRRG